MIIRVSGSSQFLIPQPDHAALAAHIMRHWAADGLLASPRRADILQAVEAHDSGWRQVDAAPLVAQHSIHVYALNRTSADWTAFFLEMASCTRRA
jgi:hypothetical protein